MIAGRLPKQKEHNRMLSELYVAGGEGKKYLSPSAINTWVNCRMRFYYKYVCDIPEEEKLEKDIDQRRFGNILHDALQKLYEPFKGIKSTGSGIKTMSKNNELIRNTIISTASAEMRWDIDTLMAGKGVIIIDVLERYITDLLKYDSDLTDLTLLNLEDNFSRSISAGSENIMVRIGGRADRVDTTGGAVRVVDYKTGTPKKDAVKPDDLFNEEKEKRNDALLQAMLYCHLIRENYPGKLVLPAVYWVQQISSEGFTPYASAGGLDGPGADTAAWNEVMRNFAEGLSLTVNRIFSDSEDYVMTSFVQRCTWCPYRMLCRR
jgi:CRISPR/Cas system-associated exonuclease Cas4 (RecB family)